MKSTEPPKIINLSTPTDKTQRVVMWVAGLALILLVLLRRQSAFRGVLSVLSLRFRKQPEKIMFW